MSIGDNIKKARGRIKQTDLAEMLDVDVSTISRWENDKNIPNGEVLSRIAQALNTSTEFLVGTNQTEPKQSEKQSSHSEQLHKDTDVDFLFTGGVDNNMFVIKDWKADRTYYFPNNEEGRALFLSVLASGMNETSIPVLSNTISGNNNSNNKLGVINH